eukprot:403362885
MMDHLKSPSQSEFFSVNNEDNESYDDEELNDYQSQYDTNLLSTTNKNNNYLSKSNQSGYRFFSRKSQKSNASNQSNQSKFSNYLSARGDSFKTCNDEENDQNYLQNQNNNNNHKDFNEIYVEDTGDDYIKQKKEIDDIQAQCKLILVKTPQSEFMIQNSRRSNTQKKIQSILVNGGSEKYQDNQYNDSQLKQNFIESAQNKKYQNYSNLSPQSLKNQSNQFLNSSNDNGSKKTEKSKKSIRFDPKPPTISHYSKDSLTSSDQGSMQNGSSRGDPSSFGDNMPIKNYLLYGTDALPMTIEDENNENGTRSSIQETEIDTRNELLSLAGGRGKRERINTIVEKTSELNKFHLKINIAINIMIIAFISLQLTLIPWISYPIYENDELSNGKIHIFNFYGDDGLFQWSSDFKLNLAFAAFDHYHCLNLIDKFQQKQKLRYLCDNAGPIFGAGLATLIGNGIGLILSTLCIYLTMKIIRGKKTKYTKTVTNFT